MDFSRLDALLSDMPERGIPVCELALSKDGETVYRQSVGYCNKEKGIKASEDTLYWIFSVSKTVTCTAAARLLEEGKISLSDPVSKYLPEFADLTVSDGHGGTFKSTSPMTVLHLFTMTGGMTYDIDTPNIKAAIERGEGTLGIVGAMAKDPLFAEPGEHYRYCLCHDVLAAVVEKASGMRFSEYVKKTITDPLGMYNTGMHPTKEQEARLCDMYTHVTSYGTAADRKIYNAYVLSPDYDSGGAGFFSSTDDMLKFAETLALGGTAKNGYRLLKEETVKMMEVNRLNDVHMNDYVGTRHHGYGWGLCGRVHINPAYSLSRSSVGEFGWDGAAASYLLVDRPKRFALYLSMSVTGCVYAYQRLHPYLRDLAYEAVFGE